MPEYRLTCFGQSGNAYKPALYFALSGTEWTPVFIDFMHGAHKQPEFIAKNDMAQVPVLEHGDVTIAQSGVILDYLVEQIGQFGWESPEERREVMRWVFWDNYSFTSILAPLRFIANFVPEEKRDPGALAFLQQRMANALKTLNKRLEGREWVALDRPTIADLSIAGYIHYGEELPFDLSDYPNVEAWKDRLAALPGWKPPYELMPLKG
jgi:glutathione S-transferase